MIEVLIRYFVLKIIGHQKYSIMLSYQRFLDIYYDFYSKGFITVDPF